MFFSMGVIPLAANIQFVILFFLMGAIPAHRHTIAFLQQKINGQLVVSRKRSRRDFCETCCLAYYGSQLPLCHRAVGVAPDGVLPVVGSLILFDDQFLIHFHTQTRALGHIHKAVYKLKVILVGHVVQNALAHIVVDTDALLLDHGVVAGGIYVKAGCQGDGT